MNYGNMNYGEMTAVFENKFQHYSAESCAYGLKDCHATLACHRDMPTDDPYYIKLWAEIDALRGRQLQLVKENEKNLKILL